MKIGVNVQGKNFEVDIIDPLARPVVAYVEGERFEIWPDEDKDMKFGSVQDDTAPKNIGHGYSGFSRIEEKSGNGNGNGNGNGKVNKNGNGAHHSGYAHNNGNRHNGTKPVHAPIPGIIRSVDVSPGDQVIPGQQLCVLEAMKMYNSIRATRAGVIAAVHVSPGEHVGRNEVLVMVSDGVV